MTTVSNSVGEMAPPGPVFSYAQAAKSKSSVVATTNVSSKTSSDSTEETPKENSVLSLPESAEAVKLAEAEASKDTSGDAQSKGESGLEHDVPTAADSEGFSSKLGTVSSSRTTTSAPSSPSIVTNAALPIGKDDDVFAVTNELESTWDKVSQVSQSEDKSSNKTEGDGDDSKLSSWEHVKPQLKDAPPPSVNFWEKRAMDAQAKSKDSRQVSSNNTIQKMEHVTTITSKKAEPATDSSRADKRKTRSGSQVLDERNGATVPTDGAKTNEVKARSADDDKHILRGTRNGDTMKANSSMAPPPPPGDATFWPTPDLAKEEERKKAQDRNERAEKEKTPNKPHSKEKWVQVPYVPSAVFNTPLPTGARRGGRGGGRGGRDGGGRGGHSVNGSIAVGDRTTSGGALLSSSGAPTEHAKGDMGSARSGPLPGRQKRASSAGPPILRDQSKPGGNAQERRDDSGQKPFSNAGRFPPSEARRTSTSTQTEQLQNGQVSPSSSRRQYSNGTDRESGFSSNIQDQAYARGPDRRTQDFAREGNGFTSSRERGEARPDRGRGGYRGNRGHNGFGNNANGPPNAQTSQGYTPAKSQSYTEQRHASQPGAQPGAPPYAAGRDSRHSRAKSRSQSIPHSAGYGRFAGNGPTNAPQHLPAIQTEVANMYGYQPNHQGVMSAMPYHPYMEHMQLQGMVMMQMEYYFSLDNLCKDMFLRKHMDSEGWVFLSVLQKFNRIKQLTSDLDLLRYVCSRSHVIEFRVGPDNVDRVRKNQDWQQWVLAMEDRDTSAQHDGPPDMRQPQVLPYGQQDFHRGSVASNPLSPRASFSGMPFGNQHVPFNSQGDAGQASDSQITSTPLSAAVPDFTPSLQPLHNHSFQNFEAHVEPESTFPDQQIEELKILIRKPINSTTLTRPSFSTGSRSFSNGSLDPKNISDEASILNLCEQRSATPTKGEFTQEGSQDGTQRSNSPLASGTTSQHANNIGPTVFWVKGGNKESPIEDLPDEMTYELYTNFRPRAIKAREQMAGGQCHRDMQILYEFWSHFLIRNFNAGMYEEFRRLALDDSTNHNSLVGLHHLITFYDKSILGRKLIADALAKDYVDLVRTETEKKERPAFDKLRAAWRNGAFNFKNRVKIDKILDINLKAELER